MGRWVARQWESWLKVGFPSLIKSSKGVFFEYEPVPGNLKIYESVFGIRAMRDAETPWLLSSETITVRVT
jgi:hypothetical protein